MSECNLAQIVFEILNGKVLVFPTETSYGLGCDATNQEAVARIFKIKGRVEDKPLLIVVDSIESAKKYLKWNDKIENLAKKYWPGSLTIVGEYGGENLADGIISKDGTIAVRVSAYPLFKSIIEKIGRPLVATSANLADEPSLFDPVKIAQVFENKADQPDIILNYGILSTMPATTIVSVVGNEIKIIRQGSVVLNEI